ncbi:MAG: hypothetical protein JNL83_38580 [Myxococcales bacterium]|nr:hypothetical protein [Myxococcales bacterium]
MRAPLVVGLLLLGPATVRAEPCAPRAVLTGDAAAIERVGAALVKLGVVLAPGTRACPAAAATVELAGEGGIAVAVRGSGQRSEGRVVSDAGVAATWIDAWVRDDLDVATWAPPPIEAGFVAPPAGPAPGASPPRDTPVAGMPSPALLDRVGFSAAYVQAWSDDDTTWSGGALAGCMRVGAACIGGRVRAMWQPDRAANLSAVGRSEVAALATASLRIPAGNTVFSPELGLGVGRFTTRRVEGTCVPPNTMPPPCADPTDPMCQMNPGDPNTCLPDASGMLDPSTGAKLLVGDDFENVTYTPRIALSLRVSVPLFSRVWLDGLASYEGMPLAHGGAFRPEQVPAGTSAESVSLPGEPSAAWLLGVGLRLGAP